MADCELHELATFPLCSLSSAQGRTGMRRWYIRGVSQAQLKAQLRTICASHWPDDEDCVPVSVQWGAPDDKVVVGGDISDISTTLPDFDQYMIVAQYQTLHLSDPWPMTGKPAKLAGTVLALQVRGGGEMLQIDPMALSTGGRGGGAGAAGCITVELGAEAPMFNSRIRIPLTEYHITCDRITDAQLCSIMAPGVSLPRKWKNREGTVNYDWFMNEAPGTLLFDTWTLDQTFAPDVDNCRRWRLTCVLRCRQVPESSGSSPVNCQSQEWAIGWNHDYKLNTAAKLGWWFIMMRDDGARDSARHTPYATGGTYSATGSYCPKPYVPRYPYMPFRNLFCSEGVTSGCEENTSSNCGFVGSVASAASLAPMIEEIVEDSQDVMERKEERDALRDSEEHDGPRPEHLR